MPPAAGGGGRSRGRWIADELVGRVAVGVAGGWQAGKIDGAGCGVLPPASAEAFVFEFSQVLQRLNCAQQWAFR